MSQDYSLTKKQRTCSYNIDQPSTSQQSTAHIPTLTNNLRSSAESQHKSPQIQEKMSLRRKKLNNSNALTGRKKLGVSKIELCLILTKIVIWIS